MGVSARFYIDRIELGPPHPAYEDKPEWGVSKGDPVQSGSVTLHPSTKDGKYKEWSEATPSGEIKLNMLNPRALAWFQQHHGKDIPITFGDPEPEE
jgi:hypothetical protein